MYMTKEELREWEEVEKKYHKIDQDITLEFDDDKNVLAKQTEIGHIEDFENKNLMNTESTATSRPTTYPESTMRTMDYRQGYPPRRTIPPYTNNNPSLRTMGRRSLP